MKKCDYIFAGLVLMFAGFITIWYGVLAGQDAGQVTVTVESEVYGTYLLSEDQEIWINDTNVLVIEDHKAYMKDATCPNKDCVKQKAVSKKGETLTCLPHRVIVEVTSGESSDLDAVAN